MAARPFQATSRGFTSAEFLVTMVVVVVLLLLGLNFLRPTFRGDSPETARAEADIKAMVAAVLQYRMDYGTLPAAMESDWEAETDLLMGEAAAGIRGRPNSDLFYTLRAIPAGANAGDALNKRRTVFFDVRYVRRPGDPKDGLLDHPGAALEGCYFDPWGRQYNVVIDTNGDGRLGVGAQYSDLTRTSAAKGAVGAFSLGKDRELGKGGNRAFNTGGVKSDDLVSWQ